MLEIAEQTMPSISNEVYVSPNFICVQLEAKYSLVYKENKWRFQKSKFWDIIVKQYRSERHVNYFSDLVTQLGLTYTNRLYVLKTITHFPFSQVLYFFFIHNILCLFSSILQAYMLTSWWNNGSRDAGSIIEHVIEMESSMILNHKISWNNHSEILLSFKIIPFFCNDQLRREGVA